MPKLKFGLIADAKLMKLTLNLPAVLYRDLVVFVEILGRDAAQLPV